MDGTRDGNIVTFSGLPDLRSLTLFRFDPTNTQESYRVTHVGFFLNGEAYQADSTGKVHHITDKQTTLPFASIHFDQPEASQKLPFKKIKYSNLTQNLKDEQLFNVFSALKLHGEFAHVHVRIVTKQAISKFVTSS